MKENELVSLGGIYYRKTKNEILKGLDLLILKKEWIACIGQNGSGKTTLIKNALGIVTPQSGRIITPKKNRIAYMPQKSMVFVPSSCLVRDIMLTTCEFYDSCRNESILKQKQKCITALKCASGEHLWHRRFNCISIGQKKSVELAQCLLHGDFDLIVMDEPFSSIDRQRRIDIMLALKEYHLKKPFALFMVSHDVFHIKNFFDRTVHLHGGKLHSCNKHLSA